MIHLFDGFLEESVRAVLRGSKAAKVVVMIAGIGILTGGVVALIASYHPAYKGTLEPIALALFGAAAILFLGLGQYEKAQLVLKRDEIVEEAEKRVRENPKEPEAAWDLARIKLEGYINRNLSQVGSIFALSLTAMIVGFVIIGYGVWRAFESPENLKAATVAAASGILIEFISATFLFIYRSTIQQAQAYVSMLEKITAVGMSIHILEGTPGSAATSARTELALQLLSLYGGDTKSRSTIRKRATPKKETE